MKPGPGKPVIGIVGGVAAGKSTAAAALGQLGCAVIDADAIAGELLDDEAVRRELGRHFGGAIFAPDGTVDRKALGGIVFADGQSLARLNEVLHPRIRARIEEGIAEAQSRRDVPAVVLDAAVLFEARWDDLCSDIVFVEAPAPLRRSRAEASRGWDRTTWEAREKSQISLDKKARKCHHVVDSCSGVSYLHEQIRELFHRIVPTADRP